MPPKTIDRITDVNFDLEAIKPFLSLIPSLNHSIVIEGIELPSPITHYLHNKYRADNFNHLQNLDTLVRSTKDTCVVEFTVLIKYIDTLIDATQFIIGEYGHPLMMHVGHFPKVDYYKGHASLLRCKLDRQFDFVRALQTKKQKSNLKPAQYTQINAKIASTYKEIAKTADHLKAFLDHLPAFAHGELQLDFKFRFYQAYTETLIYKSQILDQKEKNHLNALPTDFCLTQMEETLSSLFNRALVIDFHLVKSRVELRINRNPKIAYAELETAKEKLTELALNLETSEDLIFDYNNQVSLVELSLYSHEMDKLHPKLPTLEFLREAANATKRIKESIHTASDKHKNEVSYVVQRVIEKMVLKLRKEIAFAKLDQLDSLNDDITLLKSMLPLVNLAATDLKVEIARSYIANYVNDLIKLATLIQNRGQALKEHLENREKRYDELAKSEALYNENFDKTLAQFESEGKAAIAKRPKLITYIPAPLPALPSLNEIMPPAQPTTPILTLVEYAAEYIGMVGIDRMESLLDNVRNEDHAEAQLYIGDEYFRSGRIHDALNAYEKAFQQTQLEATPNLRVLDAIILQLDYTKLLIEKRIKHVKAHQQLLKETRDSYIIELGKNALKIDGVHESELNVKNQRCWDRMYQRGQEEFIEIGKRKRSEGKPLSPETSMRHQLASELEALNSAKSQSETIMNEVKTNYGKENFPALSANPSSLFQAKPEAAESQPKANKAIRKNRKRR